MKYILYIHIMYYIIYMLYIYYILYIIIYIIYNIYLVASTWSLSLVEIAYLNVNIFQVNKKEAEQI